MAEVRPIDHDYLDSILSKDIELTPDRIAYLESRVSKCFLCAWVLKDYKEHGTLLGYKSADGSFEIFPVRGEINHLNLEFFGKPYPWKEPLKDVEAVPHAFTKDEKLVPAEPVVGVTPRPVKEELPQGPQITIKQDPNAVPLSKPKQRPIRY